MTTALAEQLEIPTPEPVGPDPIRALCPHCLIPVIRATVAGKTIIADLWEWLPRMACPFCLHTRRAHPGSYVHCSRCGDEGYVGVDRPKCWMLAIDVAWSDEPHMRVIGPRTDRRRGEALHQLHVCTSELLMLDCPEAQLSDETQGDPRA